MTLDAIAQRYGVRPSRVIGGLNPFQALTLDLAAHNAGVKAENDAIKKAQNRGR